MKHISKLWIILAGISVLNTTRAEAPSAEPLINILAKTCGIGLVGRAAGLGVCHILQKNNVISSGWDSLLNPVVFHDAGLAVGVAASSVMYQAGHPVLSAIGATASLIAYRVVLGSLLSVSHKIFGRIGNCFWYGEVIISPTIALAGAYLANALANKITS